MSDIVSPVASPIFNSLRLKKFSFFIRSSSLRAVSEMNLAKTFGFIKSYRSFITKSVSYSYMNENIGQSVWYKVKNGPKKLAM